LKDSPPFLPQCRLRRTSLFKQDYGWKRCRRNLLSCKARYRLFLPLMLHVLHMNCTDVTFKSDLQPGLQPDPDHVAAGSIFSHGKCERRPRLRLPLPTLEEICMRTIANELHLYSCLLDLPPYLADMILDKVKALYEERHSRINDGNIPNYLTLLNDEHQSRGLCLSVLNLRFSTNLTNASLLIVTEECPHLKALDLGFCSLITDKGLAYLPTLIELNNLDLTECKKVTDKGMTRMILSCKNITSLCNYQHYNASQ
jgi:hypothetical protein